LEPYVIDFAEEAGALDEKAQILKLIESYLSFVHENAGSIRFFVAQILHDEKTKTSLSTQVLELYEGYRTLVTDLIARAQQRGMCSGETSPAAASAFLLAALNGLLLGHLFLGSRSADLEAGMNMLRQWLFGDAGTSQTGPRTSESLLSHADPFAADDRSRPLYAAEEKSWRKILSAGADAGAAPCLQSCLHRMWPDCRIQRDDSRPNAAAGSLGISRRSRRPDRLDLRRRASDV
jgi:hypothetical protein